MIEIDVNDFLDEADTDLMIKELLSRKSREDTLKQIREMFYEFTSDDILDLFIDKNNLSLTESSKLKEFLKRSFDI